LAIVSLTKLGESALSAGCLVAAGWPPAVGMTTTRTERAAAVQAGELLMIGE